MRRVRVACGIVALGCAVPAPAAWAAPPANDAPGGATEFEAFDAPKGRPAERQASAELAEAGPDEGVVRCLGSDSFARTVWFRVPATGEGARLLRVEGSGGEGDGTAAPDLALFVQPVGASGPSVAEAQACDGPAAGGPAATGSDRASAVEARVPAGRALLVQVGRSAGQAPERVQLSLRAERLSGAPSPAGDEAGAAPAGRLGAFDSVALSGSTLTAEDPAQPACPAAGTVWRRFTVARTGRQTAMASGTAAGTLTAFVGGAPSADNAIGCENRATAGGRLDVPFDAQAGQTVWLRVGADAPSDEASAQLGLEGPGQSLPAGSGGGGPAGGGGGAGDGAGTARRGRIAITLRGTRSARLKARKRSVRVTLRTTGRSFTSVRVLFQRRVRGGRFKTVARATRIRTLRVGTRTFSLRRARGSAGRLRRGVYRVRVTARTTPAPSRAFATSKRYRLRR